MAQMSNNIYLGATEGIGFPNLPAPGAGGGGSDDAGLIAYEQKTLKADKAYKTGDNFIYDGVIYAATANIAKDADIVIEGAGANAEALDPVQEQINDISGDLTELVGAVSRIVGLKDFSATETALGIKWVDNKDIYFRAVTFAVPLQVETTAWTNTEIDKTGIDSILYASGFSDGAFNPLNAICYEESVNYIRLQACRASAVTIKGMVFFYTKKA